jgi:hypothetical protein
VLCDSTLQKKKKKQNQSQHINNNRKTKKKKKKKSDRRNLEGERMNVDGSSRAMRSPIDWGRALVLYQDGQLVDAQPVGQGGRVAQRPRAVNAKTTIINLKIYCPSHTFHDPFFFLMTTNLVGAAVRSAPK